MEGPAVLVEGDSFISRLHCYIGNEPVEIPGSRVMFHGTPGATLRRFVLSVVSAVCWRT